MKKELKVFSNVPIPIIGVNNIWHINFLSGKNFAFVNIVETVIEVYSCKENLLTQKNLNDKL